MFSTIFLVNAAHHLKDPVAVMEESLRLLRRRGKVVISDLNNKGIELIAAISHKQGRTHAFEYAPLEPLAQYCKEKRFDVTMHAHELYDVLIIEAV